MTKRIIVSDSGWLIKFRKRARAEVVRAIFSRAAEHGWQIVVQGQHWPK